ncbi:signal peptide peptidase SppA [Carboxydothermus pertinax]|nr:signal peptide peptidase SppA [Carboxydothermus pertinax]
MGRRGWAWTIIGVLVVLAIIGIVFRHEQWNEGFATEDFRRWNEEVIEGKGEAKIVQLFVEGVIAQKAGWNNSFSAEDFLSQLNQAMRDKQVKAVVIRVDSPGGDVVTSDEIYRKIEEVKQSGKPVVVSMGTTAASGGYYISAGADRIFANPSTLTGSLGVIFKIPNYAGAAEWIGYKEYVIKSGKFKDIGNPLRGLTDEEKKIFEELVDESYQRFVDIIVRGRHLPREQVLKIADGRIYSGLQAKALGLIDEFGSLEDATEYAMRKTGLKEAKIVRYTPKFALATFFNGLLQQKVAPGQIMQELIPELTQPRLMYLFRP